MKQFNKGDLVKTTNRYSNSFGYEMVYLATYKSNGIPKYHVVGLDNGTSISRELIEDDDIELIATAKYIPIPKYHQGSIAFYGTRKVIVLEERAEDLTYHVYDTVGESTDFYYEEDLSIEEKIIKIEEETMKFYPEVKKEEENDDNEDPNEEHNSNYMKDSMPTIEKKDH